MKRLLRIERYNNYKDTLREMAHKAEFVMPPQGAHIMFFLPCPKTWSKKKKKQFHFTLHQSRSDIDNLAKGFLDSLLDEDKHIAHIQLSKRWVDFEVGWIEVHLSEPDFPIVPRPC